MAGFQTGIHQYGNSNSGNNPNLDPYTYNPRYPGLDEANYMKLSSKIDALGLTGYERENAMDTAYRQILPIVQKEIQMSDRNKILNQQQYEVSQIQDPSAKIQAQGKLSVEQLAQKVKEKFNLDPTADDQAVFNHWIKGIPNGKDLLINYLNDGNRELLYAGGLEDKVEAPQIPEGSVGGVTSVMNEQAKKIGNTRLGKVNNFLDWINLVGKTTEGVDNLAQKIPIVTFEGKVQNLANKINNLTEDDMQRLYNRYTNMVQNARNTDIKDRGRAELMWDGLIEGDQQAIDMLNTLQLADYSEAMPQDGIERNQWGSQALEGITGTSDMKGVYDNIDQSNMWEPLKALSKGAAWTTDKMKNLINFIGGSWGALENYAEAGAVGLQKLDDIRDRRWTIPQNMENNEEAFKAFVADKTANFGEYLVDAPNTLVGVNGGPNMARLLSNIPGSFVKTLTGKVRAKTNPLDTKLGLLRMLFTEEGQQALINRYGTVENLQRTMEQDPVGLASDIIDWGDKINWAFNKASGGLVERQDIRDVTDTLSDSIVKGGPTGFRTKVKGEDGQYLKNDDGTFVTRDIDITGINQGLDRVSNWLNQKGLNRLGSFVNFENRVSQTDPTQLLQNPEKFTYELGVTAREGVDIFGNPKGDIQDWLLNKANRKVQNMNRMTKKQQENFYKMAGEDQGEYMNKRGYKTVDDMSDALVKNLDQVDEAMNTIQGRFKSKELDIVMEDILNHATDIEDRNIARIQELYNKNKEGGLEMPEINEMKRYYERNNIFTYLKDNKNKSAQRATNRDTKLREWQYKMAEQAGLDNLPELNKETQALKYLVDNASGWKNGVKGNNEISLTDWIVASGGGISPESIAALVGKSVYQSSWFQSKLVDVYNYLGGREHEAGPTVDFSKINEINQENARLNELKNNRLQQRQEVRDNQRQTQARLTDIERAILASELSKVKNEQDFQNWLRKAELTTQALPYNPQYDNQGPVDYTTPTRVDSQGNAAQYGQTNETYSPNYKRSDMAVENGDNSQKSVYSNDEIDNIESDLDSNNRPMEEKITLGWGDEYYEDTDSIAPSEQTNIKNKFRSIYGDSELTKTFESHVIDDGFSLKNALGNLLGQREAGNFLRSYFEDPTGSYNDINESQNGSPVGRRTWTVDEADNMDRAKMVSKIRELYAEGEGRRIPSEIEDFLIDKVGLSVEESNSLLKEAINNPGSFENQSEYDKYFSNRKNEAIDEVNNLKQGEKIHISQENGHGYIITKLDRGFYRVEYDNSSASDLMGIEDVNYLLKQSGDRIDYDFDNVNRYTVTEGEGNTPIEEDEYNLNPTGDENDLEELRQTNPEEYERLMDEEDELEQSRQQDFDQERPITEKGKRPWPNRPEAGNDVEFNLTDELQKANRPSDIEYINQDGEWLQGTDDETLIRIAYPDNFEQYDSNSFSDRQNGRMDLLSDSGMMKLSYNDGYVNIDLMYEPTEDQINALRNIGEYDEVKRVQINILDPQAKRTVRINDVNNMDETIDYIREYFG